MDLGLMGKRVLITGSSRGIGAAVAQAFLEEGARVAITGRGAESLAATARSLAAAFGQERVVSLQADMAGSEADLAAAVNRCVEAMGGLEIVVANIGGGAGPAGLEATASDWESILEKNLIAAGVLCRHVLPVLQRGGGGSIVLISSIAAIEALPAPLPYSAAKAGLLALGKGLARTLATSGIRVNVVSPGNILHPQGSWQRYLDADPDTTMRYIEAEVPMRRFGTPAEVARAVVFLSSDLAAGFTTGAHLVVDGGQTRSH